jgi:plastocyanin
MDIGRVLRLGGAGALLIAGLVHIDLYFGGYRSAGSVPGFGRSILLNAIVSVIVAAAVAVRREWYVRLAGIAVPAGTLAAFTYTHTRHTLFGFQGAGFDPSPQAQIVLVAEIAAIVLLALTFVPAIAEHDTSSPSILSVVAIGTAVVVVSIAFGVVSSERHGTATVASAPASVTIADFAFEPEALTVPVGTNVTWTNRDPLAHSIRAADESFESDDLGDGTAFQFTFDAPGEYAYVCGIHPSMSGTVVVAER